MTLAEVAAAHHALHPPVDYCESCKLVAKFEADPEFTLAQGVKKLADEFSVDGLTYSSGYAIARRLHGLTGTQLVLPPDFHHTLGFSFFQPIMCPCGIAHGVTPP